MKNEKKDRIDKFLSKVSGEMNKKKYKGYAMLCSSEYFTDEEQLKEVESEKKSSTDS